MFFFFGDIRNSCIVNFGVYLSPYFGCQIWIFVLKSSAVSCRSVCVDYTQFVEIIILHGTTYLVRHLCRKTGVITDFFFITQDRVLGQGFLFIEALRSHSVNPRSLGLLWTIDQPGAYTHNIHKIWTSLPRTGFEITIPASERPQTQTLDRAATGIGNLRITKRIFRKF